MRKKTTTGTYGPLLAIGIAAALGGCSTQEDAQPAQFNQPPVIEAVYGTDSAVGDLPDVQLYANPTDPHYPNPLGETGATNAQDVSNLPPSYGGIIVEFNTPLDGSQFGVQNDLGSYCSDGNPAATTASGAALAPPFQVMDVDNSRALVGSICYDSASPLYRYPALLFILGGSATDPSATAFTCNAFVPASGDVNGSVFIPGNHHYALQFNTSVVKNENEIALTTPTDPGWTSGTFSFQTGGFDLMSAGFQNQNNGYYSFIIKPYAGYLKDCPANTIGCDPQTAPGKYEQPSDSTPFFINFGMAVDQAIGTPDTNGNIITDGITATRSDGSSFDAYITDSANVGGDPRQISIYPGLSWEPGVAYTITIPSTVFAADETTTLTNAPSAPLAFSACAGADCTNLSGPGVLTNTGVTPNNGAIAQLPYGENNGEAGDSPSWVVLDYSAPVDATAGGNLANITVSGPDGTPVAGTLQFAPGLNNQEIDFIPTSALSSSTTYTVNAKNLTVDASVPTLGGQAFPAFSSTFTIATVRTTSMIAEAGFANAAGSGLPFNTLITPTNQTPLDGVLASFSRPVTGVDNTTVSIQEINSDGTPGTVVASNLVEVQYQDILGVGFYAQASIDYGGSGGYALKCGTGAKQADGTTPVNVGQTYDVLFSPTIADTDESPAKNLSRQGCTPTSTDNCQDIRQFTLTPFANVPDASGNAISYTPASGNVPDTFTISFNASLDSATVNPLLDAVSAAPSGGIITLTDAVSNAPVQLTCPDLTDDTFMTITCTAPALAANHPYIATMVVKSTSPLPIAANATIPTYSGVDNSGNPIPSTEVVPADQTTCQFSGALLSTYVTPCPQTSPRAPSHKKVARLIKGLRSPIAMK